MHFSLETHIAEGEQMAKQIVEIGLVLASLAGLGGLGIWQVKHGPVRQPVVEAELQAQADYALLELGGGWASVRMDGQTAILTGEAPTDALKAEAEARIRKAAAVSLPDWVPGDRISEIVSRGGPIFGGITGVENRITIAAGVSPYTLTATASPETGIEISGYVPDAAARETLIETAETLFPGKVSLQLDIAAGAPSEDWVIAVETVLQELAQTGTGRAVIRDTEITLAGLPEPADTTEAGSDVTTTAYPPTYTVTRATASEETDTAPESATEEN